MEKLSIAIQENGSKPADSKCTMAKVVIVEDEIIVVYILQKLLNKDNHDIVDIVSSGESAIDTIKKCKPDIIIMDIFLKGELNGIEAMEEIRKTSEVPVIYTSCIEHEATIKRALAVKNSRFIRKPVTSQVLDMTIRELVGDKSCWEIQ
jgi:DNA-binding NarL/FixJ family response regulator